MKAKLVKESLFENENKFKVGDFVRWSQPRNQVGIPALYGMLTKVNKATAEIQILATGGHDSTTPYSRYSHWFGGKDIRWDGPYTKEELREIASKMLISPGSGYQLKDMTHWNPEK
jgi:hypothetical protein